MVVSEDYLARYVSSNSVKSRKHHLHKKIKKESRIKIFDADEVARPAVADTVKSKEVEDVEDDDVKPIITLVNNPTEELRLLGKFKTSSWTVNEEIPGSSSEAAGSSMVTQTQPSSNFLGMVGKSLVNLKTKIKREPGLIEDDESCTIVEKLSQKRTVHFSDDMDLSPPRSRPVAASVLRRSDSQHRTDRSGSSNLDSTDLSPRQKKVKAEVNAAGYVDDDLSPTRIRRPCASTSAAVSESDDPTSTKPLKFVLSMGGGIRSVQALRAEKSIFKEKYEKELLKAGQDLSGQNAETVVRKKIVKRGKPESTEEQKELKKKIEQKYQLWNKGVKQHEMRTVKLQEMAKEIDKPLARYRDDADLESFLKGQELKEDPMLEYIQRKKHKKNRPELPKYTGPLPPPNRFGILPGFRWDGLDRSNGFEDKLLSQKNLRKAEEEEYYKWSSGNYE